MRVRQPSAPSKRSSAITKAIIESLEPRRLLTTFTHTGQGNPTTFEFLDASGNIERLDFFGNITAEVIGARIDDGNIAHAVNLPGVVDGNNINGGLGSPNAAQPIGGTTVGGKINPVGAVAANAAGNVFYLSIVSTTVQGPGGPVTQNALILSLANIQTGDSTIVADLTAATVAASGGAFSTISSVTGASFSPVDGKLYYVAHGGAAPAGTSKLFSVDVSAPNVPASVTGFAGTFNARDVGPIAFDLRGGTAILEAVDNTGVAPGGKASPILFQVDFADTNTFIAPAAVSLGGKGITDPVTAIAFDPANSFNNNVIGLTSAGANSQELRIDITTGAAISLGATATPPSVLGNTPGGLTFDPIATDPFSGATGALIGSDLSTTTLFFLNAANRINRDTIFSIFISQSDSTGEIVISGVPSLKVSPRPMQPFTGTIGTLQINSARTGALIKVGAPANTGDVLLGARTLKVDTNTPDTAVNLPITSIDLPPGTTFGVLPTDITTLHAGVQLAAGNVLGKFLLGGTILGEVHLNGSVNQFYAGWLITGNASGQPIGGGADDPNNFTVDGDIRYLYVGSSIGTESFTGLETTDYSTGFDMSVSGTIGVVRALGGILGNIRASHLPTAQGLNIPQLEIENRDFTDPWDAGILGTDGTVASFFNNDTFATAEYVSAPPDAGTGLTSSVVVDGTIQDDPQVGDKVDYYAVPLMSGQTITASVKEISLLSNNLDLGVFDPEGRLVYSDYNAGNQLQTEEKPFQFTTTEPGVYRFAVGEVGDSHFTGAVPGNFGEFAYQLVVKNVGDLAISAIVAAGDIVDNPGFTNGFSAVNGDFGALVAGARFSSFDGSNNTVVAENGNLRTIEAGTIGDSAKGLNPQITVTFGSVGLVESTVGDLFLNDSFAPPAIGGNYEVVSSAANFSAQLIANGSIGTIRAASMTDFHNSTFHVDANGLSNAGRIDLIDVAGNVGTLGGGGPRIITGPRGNVRYFHVLGTVFRDAFFGGGQPEATQYQPGETAHILDDSGSQVNLTPAPNVSTTTTVFLKGTTLPTVPIPTDTVNSTTTVSGTTITTVVTNPDGSVTTTTTTTSPADIAGNRTRSVSISTPSSLTVTAYGIEGSGGSAIINVTSSGSVNVSGSANIATQSAEIGTINVTGSGVVPAPAVATIIVKGKTTTTVLGSTTTISTGATSNKTKFNQTVVLPNPPVLPTAGTFNSVNLSGGIRLDAFSITEGATVPAIDNITNTTGGEIVNITAGGLGTVSSNGNIGAALARSTPADIMPEATIANAYPFDLQHSGIVVGGDVVSISGANIGNILLGGPAKPASIGALSGTVRGPIAVYGSINSVNYGAGIYPSGTGDFSRAGIYAQGVIGNVSNSQPGDIRGSVISSTGILAIRVNGGSIINAVIGDLSNFSDSANINALGGILIPRSTSPITNPIFNLGTVSTNGAGGIIGSTIYGGNIQSVATHGGFGILSSHIFVPGDGVAGTISADGYGIRGSLYEGGARANSIVATGNGSLLSTQSISSQVRYSENSTFDPFFGYQPNTVSDVNVYLTKTSGQTVNASVPVVPNVTDTGVIEDSTFVGSRDVQTIRAFQIRATDPNLPTTVNFANSIGSITTTSLINGLAVTTGRLGTFAPAGNVSNAILTIAGKIGKIMIRSSFTNGSAIIASGPNGNIGSIKIFGNMDGTIEANGGKIGPVSINGNFFGKIQSKYLTSLSLAGSLGNGSLDISGSVGTITLASDLGAPGDVLNVHGSVKTLKVGRNLNANVNIGGSLGSLLVGGSIISGVKVTVGSVLNLLKIGGDFQAGSTVQAHRVNSRKIKGAANGAIVIV